MSEAERLINEAKGNNNKELNLSCLELKTIPNEVFSLVNLETLKLMYNEISELPIEITKLKKLKNLYLSFNKIKEIPKETLVEMPYIECFDLAENPFDYIAAVDYHRDFNKWKGFDELYEKIESCVKYNHDSFWFFGTLRTFPKEVFELQNIERLTLNLGKIAEIPLGISNLKNLKYIDLTNNGLSKLPDDFWELKNLETIILDTNEFEDFPEKILDFPKLRELRISNNKLKKLDKRIFEIDNIKTFYAFENPFDNFDCNLFHYHSYSEIKENYTKKPAV